MIEGRSNRSLWLRRTPIVVVLSIITVAAVATMLWATLGGRDVRDMRQVLNDNGFIELRPPSTLIQPGTWVEVQGRNPLRLRTVCSAESALNLTGEQLAKSISADTSITRAFSGNFKVSLDALGLGDLGEHSKIIETVRLRLSNVRLIELADDQILKNLPKRDKSCAEAIKLRYDSDPKSLTMIDTVLIADAEYDITFKGQVDTKIKTAVVKDLAAKANLAVDIDRNDSTVVLGSNLVWGVKDNQLMAFQGIGLPSVGTESGSPKSILQNSGPIATIDQAPAVRVDYDNMAVRVRLDVPVMKQPSPMSCWATVYAMMTSWKMKKLVTISSAVAALGPPYTTYLSEDRGLPGGEELAFVKAAGLRAMPPADYPLSTFRQLLRERGPGWIISGNGITSHARLLVGIYGPDEEEKRSTYESTVMEFIDPAPGAYVYLSALTFYDEFEREAGYIVNHHLDWIDLRWQVLSY